MTPESLTPHLSSSSASPKASKENLFTYQSHLYLCVLRVLCVRNPLEMAWKGPHAKGAKGAKVTEKNHVAIDSCASGITLNHCSMLVCDALQILCGLGALCVRLDFMP